MPYSHQQFLVELAKRLKDLRVERSWSLRHMVVLHGFHAAHWQRFEAGEGVSVKNLLRIADAFGMTLGELVAGIGEEGSPKGETPAERAPVHKTKSAAKRSSSTGRSTSS